MREAIKYGVPQPRGASCAKPSASSLVSFISLEEALIDHAHSAGQESFLVVLFHSFWACLFSGPFGLFGAPLVPLCPLWRIWDGFWIPSWLQLGIHL